MLRHDLIISELTEWINKNIQSKINVEHVANKSGYSKWHLQRVFHDVMNMTIAVYIREQKIKLAAIDLIETNESVYEISEKYSFSSQQSFTRLFKQRFQVAPATYRKKHFEELKLDTYNEERTRSHSHSI